LRFGRHTDFIEDQKDNPFGLQFSSEILDADPGLPDDLATIWDGFWILNQSRRVGFSMSYIPLTEIKAYIELFPVGDDLEFFVTCIRAMDSVYVDFYLKKKEPADGHK
jgi:hypothetical protein